MAVQWGLYARSYAEAWESANQIAANVDAKGADRMKAAHARDALKLALWPDG